MFYRIEREEGLNNYEGELALEICVSASASKKQLRDLLDQAFRNAATALTNTFIQSEKIEDAIVVGGGISFGDAESEFPTFADSEDNDWFKVASYEIGGEE